MKTFTNCAEKKAKQFLNLLQGYTKGIRMTAILVLLLMGVNNAWGKTIYLYTNGIGWPDSSAKIWVHAWGSGQDTDKQMTKVKDQLYKADIPDADTKVIFTRTQSTSTGVWDKEWNRVGEQTLNDDTPCLKLTSWTGGTWGKISYDAHMYLDNSVANWSEATKEFMIGHSSYSNTYTMTNISNTKLYYLAFSDIWHGYWDYGFIGVNSHWGEWNNKDITTRIKEATKRTGTRGDQVLNGTKLFVPENANNDANLTKNDLSGYSALNYTQTIKSAVKLAGQNYAEANSKATITVTSYKLTGNATSTKQSASISTSTKSTSISAARTATTTLTVGTVETGYQFDGWYTTGGTKLSALTTYTYSPTEAKTVYARFSEITYSVQVKSADINQGTVSPANVNAGQFTGVTITATPKIGYSFVNWTATAGITIADPNSASTTITATKAGTVTANFEAQPATTIYLEPTGHWNSHKAVFQAHVWETGKTGVNLDMTGVGEPSYADGDNKSPYRYYKVEVPYGYDEILFFRVDPSNTSTIWNQTGNLTIPTDNKTLYEIQSIGSGTTTPADGVWKEANLVYTITLGSSIFGPYGISYNGQSYFSKDDADVVINLPYGATINFIEGQPYSDIYTGGIMEIGKVRQFDLTKPYTIKRDIRFDANYVTKVPQVAYLGVPNNLTNNWDKTVDANFIWRWDSYGGLDMTGENDMATLEFDADGVKYYKFTIQPGCNKFIFQRKQSMNDPKAVNMNPDQSRTLYHVYQVLTTDVNCYMLDDGKSDDSHTGYWCALPAREGDYRLLYVEQVVEKDANGNTVITRKKAHPSDVVKASEIQEGVIVSLHTYKERTYQAIQIYDAGGNHTYYKSSNNPEIILQRYDGNNWIDKEWHMVYGPLETLPIMANLPGRKNASPSSDIDDLQYHDGIEIIKQDVRNHPDQGNGVWNFVIKQKVGAPDGDEATIDLEQTHRYTGTYYIRTNAAFGAWNSYKGSDNHMTRSDVSKRNSNYSHYYCKWIDQENTNVTYTIANDYGMAISDTLTADETDIWGTPIADAQKIVTGETLPTNNAYSGANIRFSWNEKSNFLHRAYLAGSTNVANRFLVLKGQSDQLYNAEGEALTQGANDSDRYGLDANEEIFTDISNWVYYADVQMVPNAGLKLTAKYMDKVQYFVGQESNWNNTILKSEEDCSDKYLIRLLYDFKTNELISAYVPGGNSTIEPIQTNLMLLRKENETPRQLSFNTNNMKDVGQQAYGVLELTKATLIDNTPYKNIYARSLYWISFPFDVRITDIFGFGEYGKDWIIQSYDGAKRAREGLWADSETNWVYHFDPNTLNAGTLDQGIMKRGVGYVVALNLKNIQADDPFVGRITTIALYFPSTTTITGHIDNTTSVTIDVPEHECNINRPTPDGDRRIKDSHWNVIGVPSYINAVGNFGSIDGKFDHIELENRPEQLQFYYRWLGDYDKYEVTTPSATVNFNSLTAYMVQYAGDLTWTSVLNEGPASLAAKRNSDDMKQHHLRLELQQNGNEQDRTFIQLQENEVTTAFDFNYDLCKIINKGANIYSLIATDRDPIEVAGNVLPVEEAIIPLGIKTDAAGEYTFAMPDGTDGIVVELIDYENNTRTNMLLDEYTVNLGKGTFESRFALHVKPDKTVTSVEDINTNSDGVRKFIIDGVLYMQKDGALYDAQGRCVQ